MSGHFTLKGFLRQASRRLFAEYLHARGIDLGLDIAALKPRNIDPIVEALNRLADDQRAGLDRDFQDIAALASEAGLRQIIDEARFQGVILDAELQRLDGFLDKSLWTFLRVRQIFDAASRFAVRDILSGRYWKRGLPLPGAPGADLADRVPALQSAVSAFFQGEEGRGRSCQIDYFRREPRHWFYAFPEDYSAAPLAWSSAGLAPRPLRPAFEVIFVYDDRDGTLDVYCQGGRRTIERLWQVFAQAVLGITELPELTKPSYALEALKARGFAFIRPPASAIADLRIRRLGLAILGGVPTKVSVEVDPSADAQALHHALNRLFVPSLPPPGRWSLAQSKVISARLVATIDCGDGRKPRKRTFDLSEKTCALRYEGDDLLLRRVLIDSGIDRTGKPGDAGTGETGPAAERAAG
jgi:hypothetical protein